MANSRISTLSSQIFTIFFTQIDPIHRFITRIEEAECVRAAVKEVLDLFEGLLAKLPENQKAAIQRAMGLKIEQLKAELQQLDD
ncbi:hypothetical protein UlMin_027697 [Ulmus minor]